MILVKICGITNFADAKAATDAGANALGFNFYEKSLRRISTADAAQIRSKLPKGVQAFTVSRACASANQAITDAADQIALGHLDVAIAGGAESLSNVPILHSRSMSEKLVLLSRAKSLSKRLSIVGSIRPKDLIPITPAIAEPSTGETMGQSAEKMAKLNAIAREEHSDAQVAPWRGHSFAIFRLSR